MKISLNTQEMAAIVIAWAKKQYKTHNVSVDFTDRTVEAIIEVTISDDQIADNPSQLSEEHIKGLHAKLKGIEHTKTIEEPDHTSVFDFDVVV